MSRVQKSRKSKLPFQKRLNKIRKKVDERMKYNSTNPFAGNLPPKQNDSYDNRFNLFKQAVAERRANNLVAEMMERNSSQAFSSNLPVKNDSNSNKRFKSFKNLVAKRRASQKKKNNAKAQAIAKAEANARAHEKAIYEQELSEVFDAMAKNQQKRMINNRNKELQIYGLYEEYEKYTKYIYHQISTIENNIRKFYDHHGLIENVAMNGFIQDLMEQCISNAYAITLERDEMKDKLLDLRKLIELLCILRNLKCDQNKTQSFKIVNDYDIKPVEFRRFPPINSKRDLQYFMNDKVTLMEHLRQNIELLKINSQYLIIINNHIEDTYRLVLQEIKRKRNNPPKPLSMENIIRKYSRPSNTASRAVSQPKPKQSKAPTRANSRQKSMSNHTNGLKSVGRFTVSNVPQVMSGSNVAARALKSRGKRLSSKRNTSKRPGSKLKPRNN